MISSNALCSPHFAYNLKDPESKLLTGNIWKTCFPSDWHFLEAQMVSSRLARMFLWKALFSLLKCLGSNPMLVLDLPRHVFQSSPWKTNSCRPEPLPHALPVWWSYKGRERTADKADSLHWLPCTCAQQGLHGLCRRAFPRCCPMKTETSTNFWSCVTMM